MHIDTNFVSKVTPTSTIKGLFPVDANFSVDTRILQKGDVFVALGGAKVDGHDFIDEALKKGAAGFILYAKKQEELVKKYQKQFADKAVMFVDDTLQTLLDLAYAWRTQFSYPVVAITGTVGKTTTKEMVRNILKQTSLKFIASTGNQNTLIGVSMNILKMRPDHDVAVFELGISDCGSMRKLVELLRPTLAVVTHVGHGHMQGLGDVAMVAREKREIFSMFAESNIGIINGDQPELAKISYIHPVIRFGKKTTNQIQARKILCQQNSIAFVLKLYKKKYKVVLPTCNESRVMNALAAISVGQALGIADELLIQGIEQPVVVTGRFQELFHSSGSVLINDAYNCNPDSAKAALLAFDQYQTTLKKVVVLGDMKELGSQSAFWHRQLGRMVRNVSNITQVVLIGQDVASTKKTLPIGVPCLQFLNIDEAFESLRSMLLQKDKVFLCKASNSMRFLELIQRLQEVKSTDL